MTATRRKPVGKRRRAVDPRRHAAGDCLWPLLTGLGIVAVVLLGSGWEPRTVLTVVVWGAVGGVVVTLLRIWDIRPRG